MNKNIRQKSIIPRFANLDVIKGVCILMVLLTHYNWSDKQRLLFLFPFWIDMAVPFFMVITGYVSALSYSKTGSYSLRIAYKPAILISRCLRYIIPFIPVFIIGIFVNVIGKHNNLSIVELILKFLQGGYGPGAYYFPVMIQLMIILPIIYFIINKYNFIGLIACFFLTIIFEAIGKISNMTDGVYKLLSFRYIFIVSFGCYMYKTNCKKNNAYWIACLLGIIYIILFKYVNIILPKYVELKHITTNIELNHLFINETWAGTSVLAVLFILPIICFFISKKTISNKALELLGKASYNIFLVQMIYYYAVASIVYKYITFVPLRIVTNMVVCCLAGIVFYKIENPITGKIIKKIRFNIFCDQRDRLGE